MVSKKHFPCNLSVKKLEKYHKKQKVLEEKKGSKHRCSKKGEYDMITQVRQQKSKEKEEKDEIQEENTEA